MARGQWDFFVFFFPRCFFQGLKKTFVGVTPQSALANLVPGINLSALSQIQLDPTQRE